MEFKLPSFAFYCLNIKSVSLRKIKTVFIALFCICLIYIFNHVTVKTFNNLETGLKTMNTMAFNERTCFFLSWRSGLNLHSLRELALLSNHKNFKKVSNTYTTNKSTQTNLDRCIRFVTIKKAFGGLGNQMFQIAAMLGVAYKYDMIPIFPNKGILPSYINVPNSINKSTEILNDAIIYNCHLVGGLKGCPKNVLNSKSNITMFGFFQTWKHFEHAEKIVKNVFNLKTTHMTNAREFLRKSTKSNSIKVCIHLRRGDFLYKRNFKRGHNVANETFIARAKKFYEENFSNVQFIALSNDKEWCRTHLKEDVLSNFTDAGDDMALMILCDHVVVTSGSFGWWGAWLSGGTTVYFKGYIRAGSRLDRRLIGDEYYPSDWIGL